MAKEEVKYGQIEVELSREYPFAKDKKITLNELCGEDDEAIQREIDRDRGKLGLYLQIARSAGITYKEALLLANKDSRRLAEELEGF